MSASDATHSVRIAAAQMNSSSSVSHNLAAARRLIESAAQQKCALIALPEMFAVMGKVDTDKVEVAESEGSGEIQDFLAAESKQHRIWIVAGTIPIKSTESPDRIRAACLVYSPSGERVARYDKTHLFDAKVREGETYRESKTTEPGEAADSNVVVVDSDIGRLGFSVCYDIRFPELYRLLSDKGAQIVFIPSAFTVPTGAAHWEVLCRARAIENQCFIVGPCQVGRHDSGRSTYGNSIIVSPWGEVLAKQVEDVEGLIVADIDLSECASIGDRIPVREHRKFRSTSA